MFASFNPSDVIVAVNDYQITDFASGTFIEIVQNSPRFRQVRGIRGKSTRVHTRDRSGTITMRLMQTSTQNGILSQLAESDDFAMTALLNVIIYDKSGTTGIQVGNAYIENKPNVSFQSDTTTPYEWRIHYEYLVQYDVGGNQKAPLDFLSNVF